MSHDHDERSPRPAEPDAGGAGDERRLDELLAAYLREEEVPPAAPAASAGAAGGTGAPPAAEEAVGSAAGRGSEGAPAPIAESADAGAPIAESAGAEAPVADAGAGGESPLSAPDPQPAGREDEPGGEALGDLIAEIDREVAAHPGETAAAGEAEPAARATRRHLLFALAGTRCAIPLEHLLELGGLPRVTPVPNVPEWVQGVTNLRGDILSVLDLAVFFDIVPPPGRKLTRLLVVRGLRDEVTAGLLADEVHGIVDLPAALKPPSAPIEDRLAPYLAGVAEHGERLVSVLALDKLLAAPDFRLFEAA